ncbi:MAG: hypothetical protein HYZ15_07535 [Sphingobacteriales bacterium]|nr:hypothetical protein [Sphingobacteriales bacterium]
MGSAGTYLYAVNFYDDRGRIIQVQGTNLSGGKDTITNQYSYDGKLLRSLLCHGKGGVNPQQYKILTTNEYNGLGLLRKVSKKIGNSPETVIAENTYDDLGRLNQKLLGRKRLSYSENTYTSEVVGSMGYLYNIRGWLQSMNRPYERGYNETHWFGFELAYDYGFSQSQLNGNIAGMRWRSKGDGEQRAYGFSYDAVNRISQANFTQLTSNAWNTSSGIDFSVKNLSYDANGNILSMVQKGFKHLSTSTIDSLAYGYFSNSNRLSYVNDKANDTTSVLGDFKEYTNNNSQDYYYDGNGNMKSDNNKRISSVIYNHLNLPDSIRIQGKGTIKYTYDALGNKLQKRTIDSTVSQVKISTTLYLLGFEYLNDTLQIVAHEEGRIRPKTTGRTDTMYYDYFEKDHLGNVRIILTDELRTDSYPPASMEDAQAANEEAFYSRLQETRRPLPSGYPLDTYTTPNDNVAMVRSYFEDWDVGPNIVLKVMAGDKFNLRVSSWWDADKGTEPSAPNSAIYNIIASLASGIAGQTPKFGDNNYMTENELLSPGISNFLSTQNGYNPAKPKAFINWILLDEQLKLVSSGSGFEQVGEDEEFVVHIRNNISVDKNGYLFVYVSNETSNIPVYFDNLQVTHIRGPLIEENHYYPFGLVMSGISSKALSLRNLENKKKYNAKELQAKEFTDGSGLEWQDYGARMYNQQIGRWHVMDNYSEAYYGLTPYNYAGNTPINAIDIDGNLFIFANGFMVNQYLNSRMNMGGGQKTIQVPTSFGSKENWKTVPNPNHYAPDRGFYADGPRNNSITFEYWGKVDDAYMDAYDDQNTYYTNGSFTPLATASARFTEGAKAGVELIKKLESGEITLTEGETIKIVGHSQGAAYAAGIASALAKHSKYGGLIEFVDYLAPHQPGDITHPGGVKGRQFSTKSDRISSRGWKARNFGNSKYEKIKGTEWGMERESHSGGYHGHLVDTWLNDLIAYWRRLGITVNVHE